MALVTVVDESGESMVLRKTSRNNYAGPYFSEAAVENFPKIPLRSDDILLLSYPKCGCHWTWENIRFLMKGEITIDSLEKIDYMMESRETFDHLPSPRVLNNHGTFEEQNPEILKGNIKIVFVYRNPKDVALSLYHHNSKFVKNEYSGKFQNYIRRFAAGQVSGSSYFDYLKSFEEGFKKYPNIPHIIMKYEDLHANPISERRRLTSFLGKDYDDDFLAKVRDATTIDVMKKAKAPTTFKDKDGKIIIYRNGNVGEWKDNFYVSDSEWFDGVIEKEMGKSDLYKFVYSIDN